VTFEQWAKQWSGEMAKMPHWTQRPSAALTTEDIRQIAALPPHEFRTLVLAMTDKEILCLRLFLTLGAVEAELTSIEGKL
jgi:hypothetical protein